MKKIFYSDAFYRSQLEGSIQSANTVLRRLFDIYAPRSAIDFGCGRGAWLLACKLLGCSKVRGLDGPWVECSTLLDQTIEFTSTDLTQPIGLSERFGLAISVEVAEHLPPERASSFVDELCRAAPVVIFSAAIRHQGGTRHINTQPQKYWIDRFSSHDFECFDIFRGALWNDSSVNWWYRQNLLLFVAKSELDKRLRVKLFKIIRSQSGTSCIPTFWKSLFHRKPICLADVCSIVSKDLFERIEASPSIVALMSGTSRSAAGPFW